MSVNTQLNRCRVDYSSQMLPSKIIFILTSFFIWMLKLELRFFYIWHTLSLASSPVPKCCCFIDKYQSILPLHWVLISIQPSWQDFFNTWVRTVCGQKNLHSAWMNIQKIPWSQKLSCIFLSFLFCHVISLDSRNSPACISPIIEKLLCWVYLVISQLYGGPFFRIKFFLIIIIVQ